MDVDSDNVYMQNLQDYIFDESKIVTYKWLSNNLSIHINAAKLLIDKFLSEQKSKNSDVSFVKTFYVSGILKDDNAMVSTVVKEENLTSFKEKFQTILSEHVYSIHKSTSSTDSSTLFLAGEHEDVCKGTIKNSAIAKRTFDELAALRLGAYPKGLLGKNVTPNIAVNGNKTPVVKEPMPNKSFFKDPVVKKEPEKSETQNSVQKSTPVVPPSKQKQAKAGIAGFFSKQMSKPIPQVEKKVETVEPKKEKMSPTKAPVSNGIKKEISPEKSPVKKQEKTQLKPDKKPAEKPQITSPPAKASNGSLKTYGKQSKGKKEPAKKRKRIQTVDSDSDEDNNIDNIFAPSSPEPVRSPLISDDDEDIIPPTPEVAKSNNKAPLNSRKRKKLVDKTFMSDDGYIVTKKEEVFESCSENEEEEIVDVKTVEVKTPKITPPSQSKKKEVKSESSPKKPSPEAKSKAKKKISPKGGQGKQQSMMNFFKKV